MTYWHILYHLNENDTFINIISFSLLLLWYVMLIHLFMFQWDLILCVTLGERLDKQQNKKQEENMKRWIEKN